MQMVDHRGRLVHQLIARLDDPEIDVQVLTVLGEGARPQDRVQAADGTQRARPEGHVRAGAEHARAPREQPILGPVRAHVEHPAAEPLVESAVGIEPILRRRLDLLRNDQSGDAADVVAHREAA